MTSQRTRIALTWAAAIAAVAAVATVVSQAESPVAACSDPVTVSVDPALLTLAQEAADRAEKADEGLPDHCTAYRVSAAESGAPGSPAPDVWIPESSVRISGDSPQAGAWTGLGSAASTPVVIAVPKQLFDQTGKSGTPSWKGAVDGTFPIRMTDPEQSSSALLALVAGRRAVGVDNEARRRFGGALIALSEDAARDDGEQAETAMEPSSTTAYPWTEQQVTRHNATGKGTPLVAVTPEEGTLTLDYPVALNDSREGARSAAQRLLEAFRSPEGLQAAAAQGFAAKALEPGATSAGSRMTDATDPEIAEAIRSWQAVATPIRMLAVLDVSGSMEKKAGNQTRISLQQGAAKHALTLMPDNTMLGLWEFSTERVGAQDWKELAAIAPLRSRVGAATQRDLIDSALDQLDERMSGDTGLYDTVLAAYLTVKANHDPSRVNSVVVLTDGKNEDESGISLKALLQRLQAEADPTKPVAVITIGMGDEVESSALKAIATATGGASYVAHDPTDIQSVFVTALFERKCRPACA